MEYGTPSLAFVYRACWRQLLPLEELPGALGNHRRRNLSQAGHCLVVALVTEAAGETTPNNRLDRSVWATGFRVGGPHETQDGPTQGVRKMNRAGISPDDQVGLSQQAA